MRFVEEIVVEAFLPTVRSMLAEALRERGLTQHEVAEALGISQSAVSKYAHGEVEREPRVLEDERVRETVERVADGLASEELSRVGALIEFEVLIRRLERGDLLARLHEEAVPELAGRADPFSIHDPEGSLRTAERVLSSVRRGLRILENDPEFADLVPNTGTNLVECVDDARDIDDVAGIPGHLFEVKGRVEAPAAPEFGASEHVASVLLAARAAGSDARAAVNVRYDDDLVEALEAQGLGTAEFDAEHDDLDAAIAEALADGSADVLYQTGGFGIEPIAYLLAPSADVAAERVRALLRE